MHFIHNVWPKVRTTESISRFWTHHIISLLIFRSNQPHLPLVWTCIGAPSHGGIFPNKPLVSNYAVRWHVAITLPLESTCVLVIFIDFHFYHYLIVWWVVSLSVDLVLHKLHQLLSIKFELWWTPVWAWRRINKRRRRVDNRKHRTLASLDLLHFSKFCLEGFDVLGASFTH